MKTVRIDLKKLNDVVDNNVVKNAKFNTLKIKVNCPKKKKNPDTTALIHINQCNTDGQNLGEKN